jgi:hypothetical protein
LAHSCEKYIRGLLPSRHITVSPVLDCIYLKGFSFSQ